MEEFQSLKIPAKGKKNKFAIEPRPTHYSEGSGISDDDLNAIREHIEKNMPSSKRSKE